MPISATELVAQGINVVRIPLPATEVRPDQKLNELGIGMHSLPRLRGWLASQCGDVDLGGIAPTWTVGDLVDAL